MKKMVKISIHFRKLSQN